MTFPSRRMVLIPAAALLMAALGTFVSPWIALGYNSFSYPITRAGEAANVVTHGSIVYASLAEQGFEIVEASRGRRLGVVPPPRGTESADDLAAADQLLFVLDARPPGHLSVFSLADASHPTLVSPPVAVAVGPFSGVSAGGGRVIVSGGTSLLSLRSYDHQGKTVQMFAYDSGGDDGTTYKAADADTNPKKPTTMAETRHFVSGGMKPPVATLTFTRQ